MRFSGFVQFAACELLLQGVSAAAVQGSGFQPVPQGDPAKRAVAKCNADNCARAATGNNGGLQPMRFASCSSFMQCTVTPVPVTVTDTITETLVAATETSVAMVIETVTIVQNAPNVGPLKRTVDAPVTPITNCPTAVPTFAAACSGVVRYSSACACAGYTQAFDTIEAATETVTATVTETPAGVILPVTQTETTTVTATAAPAPYVPFPNPTGRFRLQIVGSRYNGWQAVGGSGSAATAAWIWWAFSSTRTSFTINAQGVITDNDYQFVRQKIGSVGGEIGTPFSSTDPGFGPVTFTIVSNDDGATLYAKAVGTQESQTKFFLCEKDSGHNINPWFWLASEPRDGCSEVALRVQNL